MDPNANTGGTGNPYDGGDNGGGDNGGGGDDSGSSWLSSLPDDLKSHKSLAKFTDVAGLAKSYVNAEQMLGRDKIPVPVTDDDWNTVYDRLGRPETSDKYELDFSSFELPDAIKAPLEEDTKWFRDAAHRLGLNTKQANALFSEFATNVSKTVAAKGAEVAQQVASAEQELRATYGQAYEHKLSLANRALSHLGGDEVTKAVIESGLGRNPKFIAMMVSVGEKISEEMGVDRAGQPVHTPADLQAKLAEIHAHPAYLDRRHPEHKAMVQKATDLTRRMYPD